MQPTSPGEGLIVEPIRVAIDPDLLELIPGFLENRWSDLANLREAASRGDWALAHRLAHGMKGAGGGYGFERVTEIGAALEQAARDEDLRGIASGLRDLQEFLERVEVVAE